MFKTVLILMTPFLLLVSCREMKQPGESAQPEVETVWVSRGDQVISQTFDTLRNTLLRAIGEKGTAGAVATCNSQALPLTASYATKGIAVKRTSAWLRNPANAPDSLEAQVLEQYGKTLDAGNTLKPLLQKDGAGNQHYFKPIMLQAMCLQCHGSSNEMDAATKAALKQWYPADQAVNFKEGSWRGIWHVTFYKQ